jgi:hypothetical protein
VETLAPEEMDEVVLEVEVNLNCYMAFSDTYRTTVSSFAKCGAVRL